MLDLWHNKILSYLDHVIRLHKKLKYHYFMFFFKIVFILIKVFNFILKLLVLMYLLIFYQGIFFDNEYNFYWMIKLEKVYIMCKLFIYI